MATTLEPLNHLLKASSKEVITRLCNEAFLYRNVVAAPADVIKEMGPAFGIRTKESKELFSCMVTLIKGAVFQGSTQPADVIKLFPDDFHKSLRDLLGKIIIENLPRWKEHAVNGLVSLPRLLDFDWRVDVKTAAVTVSRMSVPSCILQLQVQEPASTTDAMPAETYVNVEMSKETLDTMLDGLGKIRSQLSSVAEKT